MEIRELEKLHEDFYVPAFVIRVGRRDVVRELFLTVSSVSVDLKEKAAGRFSFTIASSFDWEKREFVYRQGQERFDLLEVFSFGAAVDISLGYGDPAKLIDRPMISGIITELSTSFSSGGTPELTVSGYDNLYWMTVGKATRNWEGKPDSFAVADVAVRNGLVPDVEITFPNKERIDQNEQTDLAFIDEVAIQNAFTFYFRDNKLVFRSRERKQEPVVELMWGMGLVSFSPEAKLGRQITEVIVSGRAPKTGEVIVGVATKADLDVVDGLAQSAQALVAQALADSPSSDGTKFEIRMAMHDADEAKARAKGILEELAQDFLTGSGESIGLPEILPDVVIALDGMGRGFSRNYYVSEATHTIDSGGYTTTFNVQETDIDARQPVDAPQL